MQQGEWNKVMVLILLVIFGWGTCTNIVLTATIMNKYHQAQEDSCLVGFWVTGSDMGNILGFLISTTLLYSLQLPYQWVIIIAGSVGMMVAVVFYLTLSESTSEQQASSSCSYYYSDFIHFISHLDNCLTLISSALLVGCLYLVLLWLPLYLGENDFAQFEGYIPICYSVCTIPGTTLLGFIYGKLQSRRTSQLALMLLFLLVGLAVVVGLRTGMMGVQHKEVVLALVGVLGFFMGAAVNVSCIHQHLLMSERIMSRPAFLLMLSSVAWNLVIGLLQMLVGILTSHNHSSMLTILFVLIGSSIIIILRMFLLYYRNSPPQ